MTTFWPVPTKALFPRCYVSAQKCEPRQALGARQGTHVASRTGRHPRGTTIRNLPLKSPWSRPLAGGFSFQSWCPRPLSIRVNQDKYGWAEDLARNQRRNIWGGISDNASLWEASNSQHTQRPKRRPVSQFLFPSCFFCSWHSFSPVSFVRLMHYCQ